MKQGEKGRLIRTVKIEHKGKPYQATYAVDRDLLTVTFGMATKSSLLSGDPPEALAALLLSEMVDGRNRDS